MILCKSLQYISFRKALPGFFKFEFVLNDHLVISISSAVLSRYTKLSMFALHGGCGFLALAGRGAAWITGTPILIEVGALYDNVKRPNVLMF